MLTVGDPPVATMTVPVAVFQVMRGKLPAALDRTLNDETTPMPTVPHLQLRRSSQHRCHLANAREVRETGVRVNANGQG